MLAERDYHQTVAEAKKHKLAPPDPLPPVTTLDYTLQTWARDQAMVRSHLALYLDGDYKNIFQRESDFLKNPDASVRRAWLALETAVGNFATFTEQQLEIEFRNLAQRADPIRDYLARAINLQHNFIALGTPKPQSKLAEQFIIGMNKETRKAYLGQRR
ncbi:hypothetical protein HDU67_008722 [Dinochytrium kinnereticum]|nr:hypothetical protein HDU67_008722 [Dinochytrium kinnereticum]